LAFDGSIWIALLVLLSALFLWCDPLDWVTRAAAISTVIVAVFIGLINGVFASSPFECKIVAYIFLVPLIVAVFAVSRSLTPDDNAIRRKERLRSAIKEWVDLPVKGFRDKRDTLPLVENPPTMPVQVEECIERKYPSIWEDLQRLRRQCSEWKHENASKRFTRQIDGQSVVYADALTEYNKSEPARLLLVHDAVKKRIELEILGKDSSHLKC
jgi:hypothetical protein